MQVKTTDPVDNTEIGTFDKILALEYLAFATEDIYATSKQLENYYYMFREIITNDINSYTQSQLDDMIDKAMSNKNNR